MKIESSQLELASSRQASRVDLAVRDERLRVNVQAPSTDSAVISGGDVEDALDLKLALLHMLAEWLAGRKLPSPVQVQAACCGSGAQTYTPQTVSSGAQIQVSVEVQETQIHYESEQTTFQAAGQVRTADGRTISFRAELLMSRMSLSIGAAATGTDPLVVNLSGEPARVTSAKIDFDLNADGQTEKVSFVSGGAAFLALDRNGDGKVNDGSELFGVRTGNGFGELAAYDVDQNGWIDEADPVYSQLRLWTRDAGGLDSLSSLQEMGVGAISTDSVGTEFSLRDAQNNPLAQVRRSGVYLTEGGSANTVQQIDLVTG